jgi:hypothetical protein
MKKISSESGPPAPDFKLGISDFIIFKENRLSEKGLGLVFAYLFVAIFLWFIPDVMRSFWAWCLNYMA